MSKIGKKPVLIPPKTSASISEDNLLISGPLGQLSLKIPQDCIDVFIKEKEILVMTKKDTKLARALHGTIRSLINNMIIGVNQGYQKSLIIEGIGYKAALEDNKIKLEVGYSHPIYVLIPDYLQVKVDKNKITISGVDKQAVGNFAAKIREIRPPDSYKGKGIRFENEILRLKPGKKAGVAAGA